MTTAPSLDAIIQQNRDLIAAGAALHWLVPGQKNPISKDWAAQSRQDADALRRTYRNNANVGIRLGEPSHIDGHYYLHLIDLDVRDASKADEAWLTLLDMLPGACDLPSVISGSRGESRHLYFLTTKPFRKKKLAKSSGFSMVFDAGKNREVKKFDWEIDLMGTGSQAVIPPSIHPDTKLPYIWERPLDLDMIGIGIGPIVPAERISALGVNESVEAEEIDIDEDDLLAMVMGGPMDLEDGQIDRILADLPADWPDDRDHWLTVGAALHHQFEGKREGFDLWCQWSSQSEKFDAKDSVRVWKSFKGSKTPVRVATLIQAASANRMVDDMDLEYEGEDESDFFAPTVIPSSSTVIPSSSTDLSDLLGPTPNTPATVGPKPVEIDPEWQTTLLARNEDGELKSNLPNVLLIVKNDKRTAGVLAYNEFSQTIVKVREPGRVKKKRDKSKPVINLEGPVWDAKDPVNGTAWTDTNDDAVRWIIEAPTTQGGYGIKVSDRDLRAAVNLSANLNSFHPVRERLEAFADKWDGKKRLETFFIDYLGCADTAYHRQAAVVTLLGAVARVYEPGHKFDFVPILEGAQGAGKSTFVKILGMNWSSELTGDIKDPNKMVEGMQGSWIIEIGELSTMHRSEVNDLKAFVSRTHDKTRLAYGRRTAVYPRQCIFIGSTNDREYLRDSTGNRRYWPIVCDLKGKMIDNIKLRDEVDMIWAEAVLMYREMRKKCPIGDLPLYMSNKEAAEEAKLIQMEKMVESAEDALAGTIIAWLNGSIVDGDGFDDPGAERPVHNETCINQIWEEILDRSGSIPSNEAMKIGKAMQIVGWKRSAGPITSSRLNKRYGKCRVYTRP